jgi:hypothetical protein
MKFAKATASYEAWLARRLRIIPEDVELKHQQMRSGPFPFMRATFYRWAQTWEEICGTASKAPFVLGVGDLHVENFGTWRDVEGRLIWGINDFDESARMPYTNDLVRLAASALLAQINCDPTQGVAAILKGYAGALTAGGRPFTLAEKHPTIREMAVLRLHRPEKYWEKLQALPDIKVPVPAGARKALERMMPERGIDFRIAHRIAGLGSLGRERYVALAEWRGGAIAREAKALAPSASVWAKQGKVSEPIHYGEVLRTAVRCHDPFVRLQKRWIVRRLAPDCSRIELAALPRLRDEKRLLYAMGWETANIHLGSAKPRLLGADLKRRKPGWLLEAARRMEKFILAEFEAYSTR